MLLATQQGRVEREQETVADLPTSDKGKSGDI